jgi:hypothetical protein
MSAARPTRLDGGIFLLSLAVLLTELALTRIFSVTMFYHLSFMVVSLAMLGFGASGLVVNLAPGRFPEHRLGPQAGAASLLFAVTSVGAVGLSFQLPVSLDDSMGNSARIALTYVACALPFFCGGLVVSLILSHRSAQASRLYCFDLAGAATGCLIFIPATDRLGAPTVVLMAGAVAAVAAAVLALRRSRRLPRLALAVAGCLLVWAAINGRTHFFDVRFVKGSQQQPTLALRWNSFSRVEVLGTPGSLWHPRPPVFAGFSSRLDPNFAIPEVWLRYDADAASQITYFDGDLGRLQYLGYDVSSSPYQIRRYRNVLVIGPGGGRDILTALALGSGPVTGVEINPITVELLRTRFRTFSGGLYSGYPGVTVVNDDGRSFLRQKDGGQRYELIEASLVDTWAASAAGAYSLTENSLYTVEAFGDYFDRLTPDGVVCFNRWFVEPPVESLRVASLAKEALRRRGVGDPAGHVMVVRTDSAETLLPSLGSILVKRMPFAASEVAALRAFAADMGFVQVYTPGQTDGGADFQSFRALLAPDGEARGRGPNQNQDYDLSPVTDDRPFFFSRVPVLDWLARRIGIGRSGAAGGGDGGGGGAVALGQGGQTLLVSLATTLAATVLLLFIPYWAGRRRARARAPGAPAARRGLGWAMYFAALGLGFILVEIVLLQRFNLFLGYPAFSLSVVLFTVLLSSAGGSLIAGRLRTRRGLARALGGLTAALVAHALALPPVLGAARGQAVAVRIALAVAVIAPLGLLMGIPFAAGIRRAGAESKDLVSWAWAVNGGASVFGSALAVLLAMTYGFTTTFMVGAGAYAVALLVIARLGEQPA